MLSYIPGAGGSGNNAVSLRSRITSNPPDHIVSIAGSCGDKNNCIGTGYNMAKGLNMNVTKSVTVCYSASGYVGINHTANFLKNHPEISSAVISCEPYPYGSSAVYKGTAEQMNAMKQSGTKLIFVTPKAFHIDMRDEISSLSQRGLEAYWLQTHYTTSGNHYAVNWDVLNSGMIDYILGERDDFNKNPNKNYKTNYKLIGYDEKTGKLVYADYDQLVEDGIGVLAIPDPKQIMNSDTSKAKIKTSPAQKKYESLKDLADKTITSKDGSPISSEYSYVSDTMNNLKHLVKNTSFLGGLQNVKCNDSSGIPGCIMGYINSFFDIVGCLLNDLAMEADAIISYGQAMVDMDLDLKNGAESLGQIVEESNSSKYIAIGGLEAFTEPDEEEKAENQKDSITDDDSNIYHDDGSGDNYYDGGYSPSSPGYAPQETPYVQPSTEKQTTSKEDSKEENYDDIAQDVEEVELNEEDIANNKIIENDPIVETTPQETPKEEITTTETPTNEPVTQVPQTTVQQPVEQQPVVNSSTGTYTEYPRNNIEQPTLPVEEITTETPTIEEATLEPESTIPNIIDTTPTPIPNYTKIPTTTTPVETKKKGSSVLPIIGGIAAAAAAGIGAKAYIDKKTNAENDEKFAEDNPSYTEFQEDLDYEPNDNNDKDYEGAYSARNLEDIESLQ
jgi:hypothetical protein